MNLFRPIDESRKITISWRKDLNGKPRSSQSLSTQSFPRQAIEPRNQQILLSLDPIREHSSEQESSIPGVSQLSNIEAGSVSDNPDGVLSSQNYQMSISNRA